MSPLPKIKAAAGQGDRDICLVEYLHDFEVYIFLHGQIFPSTDVYKRQASNHAYREPMVRFLTEIFSLKDSAVDTEFADGHTFDLGSIRVEAVHTPGHSAGHTCFFIPAAKIIFLGDIDLSSFGPWYGCLDSDIDTFLESIERVKSIDFETAVSSHKGVLHGKKQINEKLDRYGERIISREDDLLTFLAKERTTEEIINKAFIYGRFPEPAAMYRIMEKTMISKHLRRLLNRGQIRQTEEGLFKAV